MKRSQCSFFRARRSRSICDRRLQQLEFRAGAADCGRRRYREARRRADRDADAEATGKATATPTPVPTPTPTPTAVAVSGAQAAAILTLGANTYAFVPGTIASPAADADTVGLAEVLIATGNTLVTSHIAPAHVGHVPGEPANRAARVSAVVPVC